MSDWTWTEWERRLNLASSLLQRLLTSSGTIGTNMRPCLSSEKGPFFSWRNSAAELLEDSWPSVSPRKGVIRSTTASQITNMTHHKFILNHWLELSWLWKAVWLIVQIITKTTIFQEVFSTLWNLVALKINDKKSQLKYQSQTTFCSCQILNLRLRTRPQSVVATWSVLKRLDQKELQEAQVLSAGFALYNFCVGTLTASEVAAAGLQVNVMTRFFLSRVLLKSRTFAMLREGTSS